MGKKAFVFDIAKCSGCYCCQLACKDEHCGNDWSPIAAPQPDIGQFWMKVNDYVNGSAPKVRVHYVPHMCNHCENPACVAAAKDGAVYVREDGLVIIDSEKAVGQKQIAEACPYGAIYWNEELALPQKCTGCAHLVDEGELPHCVDVCATGALRFGEEEEFAKEIANAVRLTSPEHGGHVYYLNLPKLFISGDVWDPALDEVIEGAEVTLFDTADMVFAVTETDGFGDFWFKGLEPGEYRVEVTAEGYEPMSRQVNLRKSFNIGDFQMKVIPS